MPTFLCLLPLRRFPIIFNHEAVAQCVLLQLCQLLEGDYGTIAPHKTMVTYESFESSYWTHFPQTLTKGLGG